MPEAITRALIGRPINFRDFGGDDANRRRRVFWSGRQKLFRFSGGGIQYEPVAAGTDYEATLREEERVLVVADIGGGTDCSMLLMGPAVKIKRADRENTTCWDTAVAARGRGS